MTIGRSAKLRSRWYCRSRPRFASVNSQGSFSCRVNLASVT